MYECFSCAQICLIINPIKILFNRSPNRIFQFKSLHGQIWIDLDHSRWIRKHHCTITKLKKIKWIVRKKMEQTNWKMFCDWECWFSTRNIYKWIKRFFYFFSNLYFARLALKWRRRICIVCSKCIKHLNCQMRERVWCERKRVGNLQISRETNYERRNNNNNKQIFSDTINKNYTIKYFIDKYDNQQNKRYTVLFSSTHHVQQLTPGQFSKSQPKRVKKERVLFVIPCRRHRCCFCCCWRRRQSPNNK